MKFFPYVFKNLFRKKTRSILTLGSILVLLFAICIMGTLLATLSRDPSEGKGMYRLVVRHKVSLTNFIPQAYGEKIRQLGGIEEMSTWCWFGGKYIDYSAKNQFARFAVEPDRFLKVFDEAKIIEGSAEDWISDRSGALVGDLLMQKYGWKLGQKLTLAGDIYPITVELTIRAVYTGPQNAALFFNWKYVEEALPRTKGRIGTFYIKADSPEAVARLPKEIDAMFENSDIPTKTETEKEFQNGFLSMLGNVKLILNGISVAILFVILLITANTIAMSARERVTEIAVLRTLGFQKGTILGMILGESFLLSIFGGLVGIVFFIGIFPGFKKALMASQMSGFAAGMKLFPSVLVTGFSVAVLVGLFAGLVPAIRSAQRSIPDGLRQVG
jgi:putative ABC transport system permease protein